MSTRREDPDAWMMAWADAAWYRFGEADLYAPRVSRECPRTPSESAAEIRELTFDGLGCGNPRWHRHVEDPIEDEFDDAMAWSLDVPA